MCLCPNSCYRAIVQTPAESVLEIMNWFPRYRGLALFTVHHQEALGTASFLFIEGNWQAKVYSLQVHVPCVTWPTALPITPRTCRGPFLQFHISLLTQLPVNPFFPCSWLCWVNKAPHRDILCLLINIIRTLWLDNQVIDALVCGNSAHWVDCF